MVGFTPSLRRRPRAGVPKSNPLTVLVVTVSLGLGAADARAADPIACAELAKAKLPGGTITVAALVPAGGFKPPASGIPVFGPPPSFERLPAFCRVAATLAPTSDSEIAVELWMPAEGWNGKLVGTGNGGMLGAILYGAMIDPLMRGYAVTNTNTGHDGGAADASFAIGHPEKLVDYAWRAVHEMTVAAKTIIARHYGSPARRAYWVGCSSGGRQGLVEAQRFPADYDAISAGAPANDWYRLLAQAVLMQRLLTDPIGGLAPAQLGRLKNATLDACDRLDGVIDRVIDEPRLCHFDVASLQCRNDESGDCLTQAQVETARQILRGVVDPRSGDVIFPGLEPASEQQWFAFRPGVFPIGVNFWRDVVYGDPSWDPASLDLGAGLERAMAEDEAKLVATDPDLSAFAGRGGKLLLWHGWTDGLIPSRNTIQYYGAVQAALGPERSSQSVRLFMLPGVDHCTGGEGAFDFDVLGVLDEWVQSGEAPERLVAGRPLQGGGKRTRPLCAYPAVGRYSGAGATDDASSFVCGPGTTQ